MRPVVRAFNSGSCGCASLAPLALPPLLCLAASVLLWLGQPLILALPAGYAAEMCVAVATAGWDFVSVEIHWERPGDMLARPWSRARLCGALPWWPALRSSGKHFYWLHTR
jgi:hypothetical protein